MTWNGSATILLLNQSLDMPASPSDTLVLMAASQSANQGTIEFNTGNEQAMFLNTPVVLPISTGGTAVFVVNVSPIEDTPILVQLAGPSLPGSAPKEIPIGLPGISLAAGQIAQAIVPQQMQLIITSILPTTGIVTIIGGPANASGNNAYVIGVNWPKGAALPAGYYAVTSNRSYTMSIHWAPNTPLFAVISPGPPTAINVMLL